MQNPYLPDGGSMDDFDPKTHTRNLSAAVPYLVQWISEVDDGDDYLDSYIYDYIRNRLYPDEEENVSTSYALRLLIHYIGDLMQPLHNENLYDADNLKGDSGGNSFTLPYHYGADELHAVIDVMVYSQHNSIPRPISNDDWTDLQTTVSDLMTRNEDVVENAYVYENTNFFGWGKESYDLGITFYDGIEKDVALPQDWIDEKLVITEQRVMLAGYRLAYLIEYCFPSSSVVIE